MARAGCSQSDNTITCTGSDALPYEYSVTETTSTDAETTLTTIFGDFGQDISVDEDIMIEIYPEAGGNGVAGVPLTVEYDAGSNSATSTGQGFFVKSFGSGGSQGSDEGSGTASGDNFGGDGGPGGDGGAITYEWQDGDLADVDGSSWISDAGRGGNGGEGGSDGKTGQGGSGGQGGDGATVSATFDSSSDVDTFSLTSGMQLFQSNGGNGGSGGRGYTNNGSGRGGAGGGGGGAGGVTVTIETSIDFNRDTSSDDSSDYGILSAISQGGSGGTGGLGRGEFFGTSYGGAGGTGGDASAVSIQTDDDVSLSGTSGTGVFAASYGGAGGAGGEGAQGTGNSATDWYGGDGGDGGSGDSVTIDVSIDSSGNGIVTTGDDAVGIFGLSFGGSGGDLGAGNSNLDETGVNGRSGSGGTVDVTVTGGPITTSGENSSGILAASLSGTGARGGAGGDVIVTSGIDITTSGSGADGVHAESMGGVDAVTDNKPTTSFASDYAGSGGDITITSSGTVTIGGDSATGLYGASWSAFSSTDTSETQTSGDVTVDVKGDVTVNGDESSGVQAISVGYDQSGDVTVNVNADIANNGSDGYGVRAINNARADGAEPGSIFVGLGADGSIVVSGGNAIDLTGGTDNKVANYGTVEHTDLSANAIYTNDDTTVTFNNFGTVTGSVNMDGDFNNGSDATLNLGNNLRTGSGNLNNSGVLSPGGDSNAITVLYQNGAEFNQYSSGTIVIDIVYGSGTDDFVLKWDTIQTKGVDITLDGLVTAGFNYDEIYLPQGITTYAQIIQSVNGNYNYDSLEAQDTATVDFELTSETITDVIQIGASLFSEYDALILEYTIDYSGGDAGLAMSDNALAFAGFVGETIDTTTVDPASNTASDLSAVTAHLLQVPTVDELEDIYHAHSPDESGAGVNSAAFSALDLHDLLHSCPHIAAAPLANFLRQRDCGWLRGHGAYTDRDALPGYDERVYGLSAGLQREIGDGLFLEIAGNYDEVDISGGNFDTDGERWEAGAAIKKEFWPLTLSASVTGGTYDFNQTRNYTSINGGHQAFGDISGRFLSGEARVAYAFVQPDYYIEPQAGLTVMQVWQDGFTETGTGPANWTVGDIDQTNVLVRAAVELGRAFKLSGRDATAYVRPGVTAFLTDPDVPVTAQLQRFSPASLTTSLSQDRVYGDLALGLDVDVAPNVQLSLEAVGSLSSNTQSAGGSAGLKWLF